MLNEKFHTVRGYQLLTQNKITGSMEDYLEMICRLEKKSGYVRIKDMSNVLNVRDSSVTKMVQKLAKIGLVEYKKYGIITLTNDGHEIGEYLLRRHEIIEVFFSLISEESYVLRDIELIEHCISPSLVMDLKILSDFFNDNKSCEKAFKDYKKTKRIE